MKELNDESFQLITQIVEAAIFIILEKQAGFVLFAFEIGSEIA